MVKSMSNAIEQCDWTVHWKVTESAGLMIYLASYRNRRVMWEGSLPYVTIDHQRQVLAVDEESGGELVHFEGSRWGRVAWEGWLPYAGDSDEDGSVWRQIDFGTGAQVSIRPHHWDCLLYTSPSPRDRQKSRM